MPSKKQKRSRWLPLKVFIYLSLVCLVLLLAYGSVPGATTGGPAEQGSIELNPRIIRFHVLAHSDDPADQALKDKVRDEALRYLNPKLSPGATMEEVRSLLEQEKERLQEILKGLLQELGVPQDVAIYFHDVHFPTRAYGGRIYSAGVYETYQVVLGQGQGQNWWCVMFPPLCLTELALIPDLGLTENLEVSGNDKIEKPPPAAEKPRFRFPLRLKIVEFFRGLRGKG